MAMMSRSEEDLNNLDVWASSLNGIPGIAGLASSNGSSEIINRKDDDDSWEVLSNNNIDRDGGSEEIIRNSFNNALFDSLVVIEDSNNQYEKKCTRKKPKALQHSASSPDLSSGHSNMVLIQSQYLVKGDEDERDYHLKDNSKQICDYDVDDDENTNNNVMSIDLSSYDAEDDTSSHVVVSSPEEPVLVDANFHTDLFDDNENNEESLNVSHVLVSNASLPVRRVRSFRDAILSPTTHLSVSEQHVTKENLRRRRKQEEPSTTKSKPKFVVVKSSSLLRNRSFSTGDLQSLVKIKEEEFGGDSEDTMEYYHQKIKGNLGRKQHIEIATGAKKQKETIVRELNTKI